MHGEAEVAVFGVEVEVASVEVSVVDQEETVEEPGRGMERCHVMAGHQFPGRMQPAVRMPRGPSMCYWATMLPCTETTVHKNAAWAVEAGRRSRHGLQGQLWQRQLSVAFGRKHFLQCIMVNCRVPEFFFGSKSTFCFTLCTCFFSNKISPVFFHMVFLKLPFLSHIGI